MLSLIRDFRCPGSAECGLSCCAGWEIAITKDDYIRISAMDRGFISGLTDVPSSGSVSGASYRTKTRRIEAPSEGMGVPEGISEACVFLKENGHCRIHAVSGPDAVPSPCASYPKGTAAYGDVYEEAPDAGCPEIVMGLFDDIKDAFLEEDKIRGASEADVPFLPRVLNGARRFLLELFGIYPGRFFYIKTRIAFGVIYEIKRLIGDGDLSGDSVEEVLSYFDGFGRVDEETLEKEEYNDPARHEAAAYRRLYDICRPIDEGAFFADLMGGEEIAERAKELMEKPGALIGNVAAFNETCAKDLSYLPYSFMKLALYRDFLTMVPSRFGDRFLSMTLVWTLARMRMAICFDKDKNPGRREATIHVSWMGRKVYHRPYTAKLLTELVRVNGLNSADAVMELVVR